MPSASAALPIVGPALSFIGGQSSSRREQSNNAEVNAQNLEFQREVNAQNQTNFETALHNTIQARVKDARKAGISPLAAMGSAPASIPNIAAGAPARANGAQSGNWMSSMGQYMMERQMRKEDKEERRLDREDARKERAMRVWERKDRRAREMQNLQLRQANLELNRRRVDLYARSALAKHEAAGKPINAWRKAIDNRSELGPLGKGQYYVLDESIAEGMEGVLAGALTAYANAKGKTQSFFGDHNTQQFGLDSGYLIAEFIRMLQNRGH